LKIFTFFRYTLLDEFISLTKKREDVHYMSVYTKTFLPNISADTVVSVLQELYPKGTLEKTSTPTFHHFFIVDTNQDKRNIAIFELAENEHNDFEEAGLSLDLGAWGTSVEIMEQILAYFGGYLLKNDSSGEEWTYVQKTKENPYLETSPLEEFLQKAMEEEKPSLETRLFTLQFIKKHLDELKTF